MRKTLLSLFFLCFVFVSSAQQTLPAFNYIPQGPTTAAFTRYGDIPVDLSTGVSSVSIPIYTLSENGINIPISISYHASGIKVDDVASSVGLGWTLNAGGIITRTVLGIKDELLETVGSNGYPQHERLPFRNTSQFLQYYNNRENEPPYGYLVWPQEVYNTMINVAPGNGRYDFHSDRFYYNLGNGESGVFRKDFIADGFKTIPYKPIKIRFILQYGTSYGPKIEMTTADGTRFIFNKNKYDVWHPEKIFNSVNTDSVVFYTHADTISTLSVSSYNEFGIYKNSTSPRTEPWVDYHSTWALSLRENNTPTMFQYGAFKDDEIVLIDSIVGTNGVVRFTYVKDRLDPWITGNPIDPRSRLTGIEVYDKSSGLLIKNINFSHSYSDGLPGEKRLMLHGIQTGAYGEEKYEFKYNPEGLPAYYMTASQGSYNQVYLQDFWGYYKGGTPSSNLLFDDFAPDGSPNLFPNEDRTKACILQEIKYPTGGKTVFEYENHRVPSYFYGPGFSSPNVPTDGRVGGLRVKKISSYAYEGAVPQVKTYEYVCALSKDYGYLDFDKFTYRQETFNYWAAQGQGREGLPYGNFTYANVCVANPMGRYIGGPQAPVYYSKVTEYNGDGNINAGKTVYYYHMPDDILGDYIHPSEFRYCGPWDKDLGSYTPPLEKKEEYKNENGQYKLIRKTETEFTKIHNEAFSTGFNLSSELKINPMVSDAEHAFAYYNKLPSWYLPTLHYSDPVAYPALSLPKKTSVYDYVDANNYVHTYTEYSYNQYGQQTTASATTSKGELLKTKTTYPVDYSALAPYNTMIDRNILSPVIEQSTYKNISGDDSFLQSIKTNYNYWDYANQTWGGAVSNQILPQTVETQKGNNDVETRIRYFSYDQKGNPVYVAKVNDIRQLYIWSYNKAYPIAQVINVPDEQKQIVSYTSFEDTDYGNWSFSGPQLITDDNTAPTGKKCLRLTGLVHINQTLNAGSSYILSYWFRTGSAISVSANSTILATSQPKNGWVYEKRRITGTTLLSIGGSFGYIDELRLYPETAQMTTFAYEPLVGMTAQCDANDKITYYTYDASGRLTLVKDDNGNILKKICYNFQGRPDACGENANPVWQTTGNTRCKPCPQNPVYFTNVVQQEERDNNVNSESYASTRWTDVGVSQNPQTCRILEDWQPTGLVRCRQLGGQNTGEQERELKNVNPCSSTSGNTKWEISGTNTTACPVPLVFQSLDVSGNYYKQNCGSQQLPKPYPVNMPLGAFTSSIDILDATNKAKAEAQRLANLNGDCMTVYVKVIKEVITEYEYQIHTKYHFNFYSDAAGTNQITLPSPVTINFQIHSYWTENGVFAYDEAYVASSTAGDPAYETVYLLYDTTFCPDENRCRHQELTIQPGRYIVIP